MGIVEDPLCRSLFLDQSFEGQIVLVAAVIGLFALKGDVTFAVSDSFNQEDVGPAADG